MSSIHSLECPGLPAEWINGWLAAVGATILDPEIKLSWTQGPAPVAVLHHPGGDPAAAIADAWPDRNRLEKMPLAREYEGCAAMGRQVPAEVFAERVEASRGHREAWTLTSTLTDLAIENGKAAHAPFDPAGPGTIKWLHHRLLKVHSHIPDDPDGIARAVTQALNGTSIPVSDNGLGFDISRLPDRAHEGGGKIMVDPVIEVLAFFGLALLPARGDGIRSQERARQRGHGIGGRREGVFVWPAWSQPLDRWGIDALLDSWHQTLKSRKKAEGSSRRPRRAAWDRLGIHAAWETRPYRPTAAADSTRGFASEPIRPERPHSRR